MIAVRASTSDIVCLSFSFYGLFLIDYDMLDIYQVPALSAKICFSVDTSLANHSLHIFSVFLLLSLHFLLFVVFLLTTPDVQGAEGSFVQDFLGQCTFQKNPCFI